jgi:hypothetical protein
MRKLLGRTGIMVTLLWIGVFGPECLLAGPSEPNQITAPSAGNSEDSARSTRRAVPKVAVPSLVDRPLDAALADVNSAGLTPAIKPIVNSLYTPGTVIGQSPLAGTQVEPHAQVVLNIAQSEIAIQPGTTQDEATGRTRVWGQLIVQRAFSLELTAQIQHVPILAVTYQGRDYTRGDETDPLRFAEARAQAIAEHLSIAWTLLDRQGNLTISTETSPEPKDGSIWRLDDPLGPPYAAPRRQFPAICLQHPCLAGNPLKILTVYPEDTAAFGEPVDANGVLSPLTPSELAEYLVALIEAHYLLFHKQSTDPNDYDRLEICKTREGRIFKEIGVRLGRVGPDGQVRDLADILEQMPMDQRIRLTALAYKTPANWRLRNER